MLITISDIIRLASDDLKTKFLPSPEIKPPRRNPSVQNKTDSPLYMREYMRNRREDGKDYQKIPEQIKEYRKKQRKRLKEKFCLK